MSNDMCFEATAVVRSYSFEVEQRLGEGIGARHLSQALVEQRNSGHLDDITSPWRSFFEANSSNSASRQVDSLAQVCESMFDQISETQSRALSKMRL